MKKIMINNDGFAERFRCRQANGREDKTSPINHKSQGRINLLWDLFRIFAADSIYH